MLLGRYLSGYQPSLRHPPPVRPVFTVLDLVVVGSLPPGIRRRFGMEWSLADEAAYQALTRASRLANGRLPSLAAAPLLRGGHQHARRLRPDRPPCRHRDAVITAARNRVVRGTGTPS